MSETEFVNVTVSLDPQTLRRLKQMTAETDRSQSAMVRVCINNEWDRTHPTPPPSTNEK